MEFIKLETQHTSEQLEVIFSNLSEELQGEIEELYSLFKYIEFTNNKGNQCMFLFGEKDIINNLFGSFYSLDINFTTDNITEDILKGNLPTLEDKHTNAMLRIIIDEFLQQNQTIDNILDKISESGIESLNNYDKSILENK